MNILFIIKTFEFYFLFGNKSFFYIFPEVLNIFGEEILIFI
jgi:hypothetical protein